MRAPLLALLLSLLANQATAAPSIADLVRDLAGPAWPVRGKARAELLKRKDPACVRPLESALPRLDRAGRTYALHVLDVFPLEVTGPSLRRLLRSKDPEVRAIAASLLYRKKDESGAPVAAKALLAPGLTPARRSDVVLRIYAIRHPDVSAAIRATLGELDAVSFRLALFHFHYTEDAAAVPLLLDRASKAPIGDDRVRLRALLYRLGRADVAPALAADLAVPAGGDEKVLKDVLIWLVAAPRTPEPLEAALVSRLTADPREAVRVMLLEQLTVWRCHAALDTAAKLANDPRPPVARAALALIARVAGHAQADLLRTLLASPKEPHRIAAADALRRLDDHSGFDAVVDASRSRAVRSRREAVLALGRFTVRRAVPPLLDALADADAAVRKNAWEGVGRLVPTLFPVRRFDLASLGYAPGASAAARSKAIATLRSWWAARSAGR